MVSGIAANSNIKSVKWSRFMINFSAMYCIAMTMHEMCDNVGQFDWQCLTDSHFMICKLFINKQTNSHE